MADLTVYLCGPISGCTEEEAKDWRKCVKQSLPEGHHKWYEKFDIKVLDPTVREYKDRENESFKELVEEDKLDIAMSDILLVNYFKPNSKTNMMAGTSMEIILGWMWGKRVIVVNESNMVLSPWVLYHSHKVFNYLSDAIRYIQNECYKGEIL